MALVAAVALPRLEVQAPRRLAAMAEMARPRQSLARLQRMQVAVAVEMPEALAQRVAQAVAVVVEPIPRQTLTA